MTPRRVQRAVSLGGEQVEGRRAVRELLAARRRSVRDVWLSDTANEDSAAVAEIVELASEARVPIRRVGRGRIDAEARTDAPQGVIAHAEGLREARLDELAKRAPDGTPPFLVVLDGVTDPQNLGAVLRTAFCAGATGAVLPRHRAVHITPTVAKAAAGAIEHLPMTVVAGVPAALSDLGDRGVWRVGLDASAAESLFGLRVATEPVALVLGAEGAGLGRLARARCDVVASIPQRAAIASLNVAAAAAVACFEVARQRAENGEH